MHTNASFDGLNFINEIAAIDAPDGRFPDPSQGIGRTCIAFSPSEDTAFVHAESEALRLFSEHGVTAGDYRIWKDAIGNLFITYYGTDRSKTVMSGSHLDSVPDGGKYDGVAGVASALELLSKVLASGQKPAVSYTVSVWRAEESPSTGNPCLGSIVATGQITRKKLEAMTYENGGSVGKLRDRFHEKVWELIGDEVDQPPIKDGRLRMPAQDDPEGEEWLDVLAYQEDHISQSLVLRAEGVDVGIVTDIGGSVRERVDVAKLRTLKTSAGPESPRRTLTFAFRGEAAHTGGTPPNRTEDVSPEAYWYRRDALIGAAEFLQELNTRWKMAGHPKEELLLLRCSTPMANGKPHSNGYTTITADQELEVSVPVYLQAETERLAKEAAHEVKRRKDVTMELLPSTQNDEDVASVDAEQFSAAMRIPGIVERIVREAISDQPGTGMACYTVTDFCLTPNGSLQCKVDLRHTDPTTCLHIRLQLDAELAPVLQILGTTPDAKTFVSETGYVQLDQQMALVKAQIAKRLAIRALPVPSMPGHDARTLAQAGVPSGMNFLEHNGISHNPNEDLPAISYRNGTAVSHEYLARRLGVTLKPSAA